MVTARESQTYQQFSAWNSSYSDHMTVPQLEQNYTLPCFPLPTSTANVAFPGQSPCQQDKVGGFLANAYVKDSLIHGLGVIDKPIDASCAPQKKFLIFDQSGNHTRLFVSPSFYPQNQILASKAPVIANGLTVGLDHQFLMKPIVEEKWDENHLSDEEDEMLEDTEEINALLYSDSDDEYDDNGDDDEDGENDEVTSTGHSPYSVAEGYYKDQETLEDLTEEVASCDDPPKRRRLLDGKYKKSSISSAERAVKRDIYCKYEDVCESSCASDGNSYDDDDLDSGKRETKVKLRRALRMLESIVPELNSKDPLSIIDKAIVYLKSMKMEAESLGLSHPEGKSTTSL